MAGLKFRMKHRDKRRLIAGAAGGLSILLVLGTLYTLDPPKEQALKQKATTTTTPKPKTPTPTPTPEEGYRLTRLPSVTEDGYIELLPIYPGEDTPVDIIKSIKPSTLVVVTLENAEKFEAHADGGLLVLQSHTSKLDIITAIQSYAVGLDGTGSETRPEFVLTHTGEVAVDTAFMSDAVKLLKENGDVSGVTCALHDGPHIVSHGLDVGIVTGDDVGLFPRLHGFSTRDKRAAFPVDVFLPHVQCSVMRIGDLLPQSPEQCIASHKPCFEASLWDAHLNLRPRVVSVGSLNFPLPTVVVDRTALKLILEKHREAFLQSVHQSREEIVHNTNQKSSLLGVTLMWDTYCSCTGVNIEAISYLVSLDKAVNTRAVADKQCWCNGFPQSVRTTLDRLVEPKDLDTALKEVVREDEQVTVWVSHKPPEHYPMFPYDGVIYWGVRPDWVVGRSMIEVDKISPTWVAAINGKRVVKVDEVWVPSDFMKTAFISSGVTIPVTVVPEAIDVYLYDPEATDPWKGIPEGFNFFSNFKWEPRKGWEFLLTAFFTLFKKGDGVNLVLKTHLYMDPDPHNPAKIMTRIKSHAVKHGFDLNTLPTVHIIADEVSASDMPKIYKAVDCFVLPTRGEGWGLPFHEAMSMALPTIGTNWGGNTHFMTPDTSLLVDINGTERAKGFPGNWSTPSVPHLQERMQWVHTHREEARQLGKRAREHIVAHYSQEAVRPVILSRLMEIKAQVLNKRANS